MFNTAMRDAMTRAAHVAAGKARFPYGPRPVAVVNLILSHADRQKLLASRINLHRSGPR